MQAIARVNRVFKDKPGGLIVDYIGIASNLKKALGFYSESGGKGIPAETHQKAVDKMLEKIEVVRNILFGFDYSAFFTENTSNKLSIILQAEDFILSTQDKKNQFLHEVNLLSHAYALSKPNPATFENAEEIAFFQAVKARLMKFETRSEKTSKYNDTVIRDIINSAIASEQVVDIFDAAGLTKPNISILSDEFLKEIEGMKYKNIAIELLKKLLTEEIKLRFKRNVVKTKSLMEMLDTALKKYQNQLLTTVEIIDFMINMARDLVEDYKRTERLGLTEDELSFYDALVTNESAVNVLGDDILRTLAREIAEKIRMNTTIDWTVKDSSRAKIMAIVKRTLNKYGYPPDKRDEAVELVMRQAECMADECVK